MIMNLQRILRHGSSIATGTVLVLICGAQSSFAQWSNPSGVVYTTTSTDKVGIGTSSPGAKLDVNIGSAYTADKGARVTGDYPNFQLYSTGTSSDARNWAIINPWTLWGLLEFRASNAKDGDPINAGTTVMAMKPNGNIGIGTTSPSSLLHVNGGAQFGNGTWPTGSYGAQSASRFAFSSSSTPWLIVHNDAAVGANTAEIYLSAKATTNQTDAAYVRMIGGKVNATSGNYSSYFQIKTTNAGGAEQSAFYLDSGGNAGIGTTSPAARLDVSGGSSNSVVSQMTGTGGYTVLRINNPGNSDGYFGTTGANGGNLLTGGLNYATVMMSGNATALQLATNGFARQTIDSSGNVGIGTTTPGYKLDVNGTINATGLNINGSPVTTSQWSTGTSGINFTSGNVGIGTSSPQRTLDLGTSGQLTFGNNGYTSSGSPGLFWYLDNTNYGIYKTAGSWSAPNYQQLMLNFDTGVVIDGGSAYGKSGTVIQPNAGNVGIGTAAPHYKLDINGATNTNGSTVGIRAYNGEPAMAVFDSAGNQALYSGFVNASNYARIFSYDRGNSIPRDLALNEFGGNVGIGTSGPFTRLHVSTTTDGDGIVISNPTTTNGTRASLYLSTENSTPALGNVSVEAVSVNAAYPDMVFRTAGLNAVNAMGTERMRITSAGNVGIGKSPDPNYKLDVNGNVNIGSNGVGNLNVAGNISAKYQDVAEWVPASEQLSAGTVVVLDSTKSNQVTSSSTSYDTRVAGVVSEQPGLALGEKSEGKVLVATTGRVRVKVDATRGPIHIGDLLVTSDIPGVAMKSEPMEINGRKFHQPGTLIGKALEPLEKGKGEILVLLSLQ